MGAEAAAETSYLLYIYVLHFRRGRKIAKSDIGFVLSVRPSAGIISAPNGRIFVKFDTWVFFENMYRNFKLH
jgi:hypothetical protein